MNKLLLELEDLGFPILAGDIHEKEINLQGSFRHLDENKVMMMMKKMRKLFRGQKK